MSDDTAVEVSVLEMELQNGDVHQMMSYWKDGTNCITFTMQDDEGYWTFGPFPPHLLECDECMGDFVLALREKGYTLVKMPEQMRRLS